MTRGQRNKNPFNLKQGVFWKGLRSHLSDPVFCQFDSWEYGYRAGLKCLKTYIQRGWNTPRLIIDHFAPRSENNVDNYLFYLSGYVDVDSIIIYKSDEFYKLCIGIVSYESDCRVSVSYLRDIVKLFKL